MAMQEITLIKKVPLTHDVFELHYDFGKKVDMKPGQFITFILPGIWGRSYSILDTQENIVKLTIKRRSSDNGGRWGSIALCDAEVGDVFKAVGPAGHFVLQENSSAKCFIGTGTGIVPLYNQIISALKSWENYLIHLLFGVRTQADVFYTQELEKLAAENANFTFSVYISREDIDGYKKGYVTHELSKDTTDTYKEFYICGMPDMIESCKEQLLQHGADPEKIFFEKYA